MMEKYSVVVALKRGKMKAKTYETTFEMDYNDKTFERCEGTIRDVCLDLANKFINDEFYGTE